LYNYIFFFTLSPNNYLYIIYSNMSSELRKEYKRLHKEIERIELEIIKQEAILIELKNERNYYFKKIRENLRVGFT